MRSKEFGREIMRGRCDLTAEYGSVTRYEEDLTGGPHLSVTQGAGPLCQ